MIFPLQVELSFTCNDVLMVTWYMLKKVRGQIPSSKVKFQVCFEVLWPLTPTFTKLLLYY